MKAWAACLLLVLLASLVGRPDIPIDETRYVSVAWEMVSGGDWLVLHRNGVPYHHKPPLLFWLIGAGWQVFGVNDWWPRSICTLFSLGCVVLIAALGRRLWPEEEDLDTRAGWLLLGSAYWLFFSTAVVFDVLLSFFVLLALYAALRALEGETRRTWGLFALAIGLGVLAKGPVILLHVLPPLLLVRWWYRPLPVPAGWFRRVGLGVLGGAGIALLWAIPAAIQGGEEFRQAIFWGQTAGRVSGSLAHRQPLWFYVAVLPLVLFPAFFWGGSWLALRQIWRERGDSGIRFCLAWLAPAFIGFSLSGGKQAHYILPLLPAVVLLLSRGMGFPFAFRWRQSIVVALLLVVMGVAFMAHPLWVQRFWFAPHVGPSWAWTGAGLVGLGVLALLWIRREQACRGLALISALSVSVLLLGALRPLSPAFDMVPVGQYLHSLEVRGIPLAHASAYNDQFHFYGRLTRPLEEIARVEVQSWLSRHPGGRVVAYLKDAKDVDSVGAEFSQPYLDGAVVVVNEESAGRLVGHR